MRILGITILILILICINACGVYSFSGADTSGLSSFQVNQMQNSSGQGPANLSNLVTQSLRDKFNRETSLREVNNDGDIRFDGTISSYSISSQAPTADETSALNRLTITISIDFANTVKNQEWTQRFSASADYNSDRELSSVETDLIEEINLSLSDEIFRKALVNW